jgi:hypothetical protein
MLDAAGFERRALAPDAHARLVVAAAASAPASWPARGADVSLYVLHKRGA